MIRLQFRKKDLFGAILKFKVESSCANLEPRATKPALELSASRLANV
jgi:hypothetical protein